MTRPKYRYTVDEAIIEHIFLARRVSSKDVIVDEQFYSEVFRVFSRLSAEELKGLYLKNKGLTSDSAIGIM